LLAFQEKDCSKVSRFLFLLHQNTAYKRSWNGINRDFMRRQKREGHNGQSCYNLERQRRGSQSESISFIQPELQELKLTKQTTKLIPTGFRSKRGKRKHLCSKASNLFNPMIRASSLEQNQILLICLEGIVFSGGN